MSVLIKEDLIKCVDVSHDDKHSTRMCTKLYMNHNLNLLFTTTLRYLLLPSLTQTLEGYHLGTADAAEPETML